jgi:hypothetical protein
MNMRHMPRGSSLRLLTPLLLALLLAGCATTPKIDWASRVGIYTHDQAILDFGPPDRTAKLGDGTVVAEWLTRRGYSRGYSAAGYGYWHGWWPYYPPYFDSYSPDYFLRLTFGPDGTLKAWQTVTR